MPARVTMALPLPGLGLVLRRPVPGMKPRPGQTRSGDGDAAGRGTARAGASTGRQAAQHREIRRYDQGPVPVLVGQRRRRRAGRCMTRREEQSLRATRVNVAEFVSRFTEPVSASGNGAGNRSVSDSPLEEPVR